jgi:hypothetical protein
MHGRREAIAVPFHDLGMPSGTPLQAAGVVGSVAAIGKTR